MSRVTYIEDTTNEVVKSTVSPAGCIDEDVRHDQFYGRVVVLADAQSRSDYVDVVRSRGYPNTWCIIILVFAFVYLAFAIVGYVFADAGRNYFLYTGDVDAFNNPEISNDTTFPLPYILQTFALLIFLLYGGVAVFGRVNYLARQMGARAELWTTHFSYLLHAGFHLMTVLLFTGYLFRLSFFTIALVGACVPFIAYFVISYETALARGWSDLTVYTFAAATTMNVLTVALLVYGMFTEGSKIENWQFITIFAVIVGTLAYWFHVLAWIMGWGTYGSPDGTRERVDIYSIVSMSILAVQAIGVHLPYILGELEIF